MSITTEISYQGSLVATESDGDVDLSFIQNTAVRYGSASIDEVASESSSAGALVVTVEDGANWEPSIVEGNGNLDLTVEDADLVIRASYPSSGSEEWLLSNEDAPPVKLKIVVLRR
ncbi:MAG: hypothetical protein H6712_27695 [Myxococcales bacterium]|nr:hypothetical protein [Myxococcales bacterium]